MRVNITEGSDKSHKGVLRIVGILEYVSSKKEGCFFSEIVNALKMPKSTLYPLIHTLNNQGYLSHDELTGQYKLGMKVYDLGCKYIKNFDYIDFIKRELIEISKTTGESCYFGVLMGGDVYYQLREPSPKSLRMVISVGGSLPAYCTGIGKALLSQFTDIDDLKKIYPQGLKKVRPATITDFDVLFKEIQDIQKMGFASECEESTEHITCIAVPVFFRKKIVAALSIATPVFRYDKSIEKSQKEILLNSKKLIENHLRSMSFDSSKFEMKSDWRNDE